MSVLLAYGCLHSELAKSGSDSNVFEAVDDVEHASSIELSFWVLFALSFVLHLVEHPGCKVVEVLIHLLGRDQMFEFVLQDADLLSQQDVVSEGKQDWTDLVQEMLPQLTLQVGLDAFGGAQVVDVRGAAFID